MESIELITISAVIFIAAVLAYKSSFLQNKKIGYLSLVQIIYLVLVPGFIYTIVFFYLLEILDRPLNYHIFLNDKVLTSLLLLSILYTYGGIAIHSVAKTLSSYFAKSQRNSPLFNVNNFFHLSFSHNLVFIGAIFSAACIALLELNHASPYPEPTKLTIIVLNGLFVGLASILGLSLYKKRWFQLRLFFFSCWLMFIILIYAVKPYIKNVKSYPITLMFLIFFSVIATLNIVLYIRRVKNRIQISWRLPKDLLE